MVNLIIYYIGSLKANIYGINYSNYIFTLTTKLTKNDILNYVSETQRKIIETGNATLNSLNWEEIYNNIPYASFNNIHEVKAYMQEILTQKAIIILTKDVAREDSLYYTIWDHKISVGITVFAIGLFLLFCTPPRTSIPDAMTQLIAKKTKEIKTLNELTADGCELVKGFVADLPNMPRQLMMDSYIKRYGRLFQPVQKLAAATIKYYPKLFDC